MAAICGPFGDENGPAINTMIPPHKTSPARKAPSTRKRRMWRGAMGFSAELKWMQSEAQREPSLDHLVEHGRAVAEPQPERGGQQHTTDARCDHERTRQDWGSGKLWHRLSGIFHPINKPAGSRSQYDA